MRKVPVAAIALVAAAAVVVPSAWPAIGTHPPTPRLYDNCTRYNAKYPHGVGRVGTRDRTSGTPVTTFRRSMRLYRLAMHFNDDLDRDKDGIACEKR